MSSRKRGASDVLDLKETIQKLKRQKNSKLDDFMVIGIDFGTTYSGAAWGTVADFENNQINLVTTWPGTGREESKAPTELFYDQDRVMWGYSIPAEAEPLRWFKLLLLRDVDLTPEMQRSQILSRGKKVLTEKKKTVTDAIADYQGGLWKHILGTIERARSKSVISALTFHVVITVPAIWPDYARKGMMDAAKKAGIFSYRPAGDTTLAFAPEPEAAALASLWDRVQDLEKGDVYVICDAGGGTVDLISYKVEALDPIQLHEAVMGTGGLCGGIFIDEIFEAMCKSRLGRRWRNLSQAGIKDIMKHEWENAVKPQFSPEDELMQYIVAVPAEAFTGKGILGLNDTSRKPHIKNGRIHFPSSEIKSAFEGSFNDIHALIDGQVSEAQKKSLAVKGIILVGGLGSSPYLYQYLHAKFTKRGIEVLQSTGIRPRTAICCGAIFKGFLEGSTLQMLNTLPHAIAPVSVASTISRKSIGISYRRPFQEGIDLEADRVWDDKEVCWTAMNQVRWYLRKGEDVSRKTPLKHNFYRLFTSQQDFEATVEISEQKLCTIRTTLRNVKYDPLEDFYGNSGKKLKRFWYDVEMVPSGASTEFAVYHAGKKIGSRNIDVEFH